VRDDYLKTYRDLYQHHWWWRAREHLILNMLRAREPRGGWKNILDVGCGDGLFFDQLMEFGDVDGVEAISASVSETGPHRSRIHVCPFEEFESGRQYTLILMLDVLEHLADPKAAIQRALELLSPPGRLLVTVPAFNELWTNHDRINQHVTRYTRRTFRKVATEAGLEIEADRYFFNWVFPVKLATHVLEKCVGRNPKPPVLPPAWINTALYALSRIEQDTWGKAPWPFGSSLLAWGKRPLRS
jgi:2-polyprenyl-3-methyl-5-hydroxy-6-metoxy-1,4-benzoquinol methylase